ncbi:hypothetical protein [Pseudomonas vanderleydeniana]|uniref:Uncharacterized protein n=1 Tax=Pseudomonas vanderleydeniana TaxID=2745495 RepID=A0A9E6PHG6_9PSED|nr:hypothetical protein [Pseudomonas vanderleydeniana]QXI26168.1 hypothetical protein HU752_019630 [Pseudomonas vanderleydeniana]
MGNLVVAHVMKVMPDLESLGALPMSLGWSLHHDESASSFYLDTFKAGAEQKWPFTSMPPSKDFPLELPPELDVLSRVYKLLVDAQLANPFKRAFLNMSLALSKSLQLHICSFCTDDNGLDFVCISSNGELKKLHCICGDLDISYELGEITIQPLLLDGTEGTEASSLHDPENGIRVLDRNVAPSPSLHSVASAETTRFLQVEIPPLGLGSFDGMDVVPIKIAGSEIASLTPRVPVKKEWWRLW